MSTAPVPVEPDASYALRRLPLPPPAQPTVPLERLLTKQETAAYLKVSTRKLDRERELGQGPPWMRVGARVLYPIDGLARWVEEQIAQSRGRR